MKKIILLAAAFTLTAAAAFCDDSKWFKGNTEKAILKSISATSELVEGQFDGRYLYPPINILDGDLSTVWCEADEKGSGIGESITIEFEEAVSFDEIQIVNGFVYKNLYKQNNRFAEIQLTQVAGEHFQQKKYKLQDNTEDYQSIKFELLQTAQTLTIKLTDIYRGTKFDDTCLGDIRLMYKGKQIPIQNVSQIKKIQEENSKLLLNSDNKNFEEKFASLIKYDNEQKSLPLYLLSDKGKAKIIIFFKNASRKDAQIKYILDVDYIKDNVWYISSEKKWNDGTKYYTLSEYKIHEQKIIDYVEVNTTILVKISGDDIYLNGVHYTILDSSKQNYQFYDE